jgi:hypothetical protein
MTREQWIKMFLEKNPTATQADANQQADIRNSKRPFIQPKQMPAETKNPNQRGLAVSDAINKAGDSIA